MEGKIERSETGRWDGDSGERERAKFSKILLFGCTKLYPGSPRARFRRPWRRAKGGWNYHCASWVLAERWCLEGKI